MASTITVDGRPITIIQIEDEDYVNLTDMVSTENPAQVINNWLRSRETILFLQIWEQLNNSDFFNDVAAAQLVQESAERTFTLSPSKWVATTGAIGISVKRGRTGGIYAHKDIALEFGSWLSPAFRLYLIKEFQRLKKQEQALGIGDWDVKRMIAKANYSIHTDAVKVHRINPAMPKTQQGIIYASEADILNLAMFGMKAADWRKKNPAKPGNIRDDATVEQLLVLGNLESLSAELLHLGWQPQERLDALRKAAISQFRTLQKNPAAQKLARGDIDPRPPKLLHLPENE